MKSSNRTRVPKEEIHSPTDVTRLSHRERNYTQRLAAVYSISQRVIGLRDREAICQAVCDGCVEELGFRMAWVDMLDRQQPGVVCSVAHSGLTEIPGTAQPYEGTGRPYEPWCEEALAQGYHSSVAFPLKSSGDIIGVLYLYTEEPNAFGDEDVLMLSMLAAHTATAVENAHRLQAEQRQRQVAEMLRDLVVTVNSTLDIDQVLNIAVRRLQGLFQASACSVSFLEEGGETFIFRASTDPGLDISQRITFPAERSVAGRAIRERKVQLDNNLDLSPDYRAEIARRTEVVGRSMLTAPLFAGDKPVGVIQVLNALRNAFTEADAALLSTTAALIETAVARVQAYTQAVQLAEAEHRQREVAEAIAIENACLHAETEQRAQQLAVLHELDRAIAASLRTDDVYYAFARHAARLLPYDRMSIALLEGDQMRVTYVAGEDEAMPPGGGQAVNHHPEALQPVWRPEGIAKTSAVGWVAGCGQPLLRHDIAADKRFAEDEQLAACGIRSSMIIPLRMKGGVTGTWSIGSRQVAAYSPDDLPIAQSMADQLAVVVENARLYRAVQGYAAELETRVEARTAELGRERERLLAVLESAGDAIVISDSQGNIEYVNPAWERLTGFSAQEVLGQSRRILQSGQTPPEVYDQLWSTVRSGWIWHGDLGDRRRDGSRFEARATVAPVTGEQGGIVNFVGVFHDVTQLKKLARMKDEFLNTAAHELRTPITSIMGFNELLLTRKNLSDEKRTRYLRHMNDQITHLKRIVDDLLDISQIESGADFIIGPEPLDLYPLLEQMIRDWQEANPAHTYQLQVSGDDRANCSLARVTGAADGRPRPDTGQAKWDGQGDKELAEAGPAGPVAGWPKVRADKNRVHQVMYNLLSNATKYSPSGSIISVSATSVGGYMEVIVTDEGIGMTEEDLSHIFEKFWRADASSTAVEGTGLGLVIVKHIVEQHGGHIWVESVKGKGTMVHFILPLVDRQMTVLIVEDDDLVREVERRILTRNDIATWVATCGQKAIEIARTYRPDLILLDLTLPDESGKEVLQALKAHPATAPIPVLVVSARSGWHTVEECHMLGAVDFLTKPFECEELLSRVRRGLKIVAPQIQEMQGSEPGVAMFA